MTFESGRDIYYEREFEKICLPLGVDVQWTEHDVVRSLYDFCESAYDTEDAQGYFKTVDEICKSMYGEVEPVAFFGVDEEPIMLFQGKYVSVLGCKNIDEWKATLHEAKAKELTTLIYTQADGQAHVEGLVEWGDESWLMPNRDILAQNSSFPDMSLAELRQLMPDVGHHTEELWHDVAEALPDGSREILLLPPEPDVLPDSAHDFFEREVAELKVKYGPPKNQYGN